MKFRLPIVIVILVTGMHHSQAFSDSLMTKDDAPKLYIDCPSCDMTYIRTELNYVNYVIDSKEADIFAQITRQTTGSDGREYTLTLEGREKFSSMNDTLVYSTEPGISAEDSRKVTLKWLELGLTRYLLLTPVAKNMSIVFKQKADIGQPEDKWDYWVFKTSMNGYFNGQSSYRTMSSYSDVSATRTTEEWKQYYRFRATYNREDYTLEDTTIANETRGQDLYCQIVNSISDHLSAGATGGLRISSYSNYKHSLWIYPTLEYNIFPYRESTRREFRFRYLLGFEKNEYNEMTIYDKNEELVFAQEIEVELKVIQPWGSAFLEVSGSHYLHDFKKNRFDIQSELSLKLFKGLSFELWGSYAMIHDQIALPKGEASPEEVLLHQHELETQYNYYGSMGLSYTFGSIYNNIVNPRF